MATHSSTLAWKIPWAEEPGWAAVHGVWKSQTRLSEFTFTFHFHALEKAMASHSSVLAWRIPGTAEPGGLPVYGVAEQDMTEATQLSSRESVIKGNVTGFIYLGTKETEQLFVILFFNLEGKVLLA